LDTFDNISVGFWFWRWGVFPVIPCVEGEVVECKMPSGVPCGVGVMAEF